MPDIALLMPLSQIFQVTITEILSGKRIEKDKNLTVGEVEKLMNQTIHLSKEEVLEQDKNKRNRKIIFFSSLVIVILELFFMNLSGYMKDDFLIDILTVESLTLIFGMYFTFFARETLPTYYDENKINFYSHGIVKMNIAGLHFNNSNWKHILRTIHLSFTGIFTLFPLLYFGISWFSPDLGERATATKSCPPFWTICSSLYCWEEV